MKKLLFILSIFCSINLFGQDTTTTYLFGKNVKEVVFLNNDNVDVSEKVSISNQSEIKLNEAPSAVYVITSKDIEKNAYRDLAEVLHDIPGFNFATDVQNGNGIAVRGIWANEAKLLVMMDGLILNDMSYGSFVIFGRMPLINIERIEIIRGGSSTFYGGVAGLGVINIITKSGKSSEGTRFSGSTGVSNNKISTSQLSFANSTYFLNDFELSICANIFQGNKSNKNILTPDSVETNFSDSTLTTQAFINLNLKKDNFEYKMLYENYNFQSTYERISSLMQTFTNEFAFTKKIKIIDYKLYVNYKDQVPWNTQYGDPTVYDLQNLKTNRLTLGGNFNIKPVKHLAINSGLFFYNDNFRYYRKSLPLYNGKRTQNFNSFGGFSEISYSTKFVNLYAAGRLEQYQLYDLNFSPRFALTKEFKNFHYKLIYCQSYKIPTIQNIILSQTNDNPLEQEIIQDAQLEFGLRNDNHKFIVNGFFNEVENIIVFGYDFNTKTESYFNSGFIDVAGIETVYEYKFKKGKITASYSNYNLLKETDINFVVDTTDLSKGLLAVPKHKLTLGTTLDITKNNFIKLNYTMLGKKFGVSPVNSVSGETDVISYPTTHQIDFVFGIKKLYKNFSLNLGVNNVLNETIYYLYPISGGYQPSVAMGRDFFIQLKVRL